MLTNFKLIKLNIVTIIIMAINAFKFPLLKKIKQLVFLHWFLTCDWERLGFFFDDSDKYRQIKIWKIQFKRINKKFWPTVIKTKLFVYYALVVDDEFIVILLWFGYKKREKSCIER